MYLMKTSGSKNTTLKISVLLLDMILKKVKTEIVETNLGNNAFRLTEDCTHSLELTQGIVIYLNKGDYFIQA